MKTYIAKRKDLNKRLQSRSGGVFACLAENILKVGGIVYGCGFDEFFQAKHIRVSVEKDLYKILGSKYVQSNIESSYGEVINDLKHGKVVLFGGTPCQIDAVKSICPENLSSNLITVDIVCHGVPSPRVWKDYIKNVENKYNSKIQKAEFRDKLHYGWWAHIETFVIKDRLHSSRLFANMFMSHNIIRESCFECPYKNMNRSGDITIADAWGVELYAPEFDDSCGVSLVIINNSNAQYYFDRISSELDCKECSIENYLQPPLKENYDKPIEREAFWLKYNREGFDKTSSEFQDTLLVELKWRIKGFIRGIIIWRKRHE